MQACDRCHARKIRCDRRAPRCSVCERANAECVHTDRTRDRKYPRGYVQLLEDKIRLLEARNEQHSIIPAQPTPDVVPGNGLQSPPRQIPESELERAWRRITPPTSLEVQEPDGAHILNRLRRGPVGQEHMVAPATPTTTTLSRAYLGSSNSVDFVKVVASNFQDALVLPESAEAQPSPEPPTVPDDAALPPRRVAQELIDAYFAHWHITFPLLHRSSLQRVVNQIYCCPGFYKQETFHAFAFDVVLAMGSVSRNRHEWSAVTTESYFARAMNKLDKVLRLPDIMPLQALLLCCHYGVFSTLRDTSTETWHLLGLAARFCTEIGLHRRHGYKSNGSSTLQSSSSDAYNLEMARRCFWCLYNLDRVVSQTLGRPMAIRDDEIDALLPSRFDDDCAESEHWSQGANGEWTCPFVEIIGLRRLSGRVHQSLHMNLSLRDLPYDQRKLLGDGLFEELTAWRDHMSTLAFDIWNHQTGSLSPFLTRAWYDVIYYNAAITLYRPSPLFPFDSRSEPAEEIAVMKKLWTFSRSSILKYSELLQQRRLNYSWITLYAVFMAGLSYVYSVSRLSKKARQASDVVSYMDVIHDTRLCSNILMAICERWNDARGSCSIFDRLSMASIQELIATSIQLQGVSGPARNPGATTTQHSDRARHFQPATPPASASSMAHPMLPSSDPSQHQSDSGFPRSTPFDEPIVDNFDFEGYFQELHGSLCQPGSYPSNEVLLGFEQDWFGVQYPSQT